MCPTRMKIQKIISGCEIYKNICNQQVDVNTVPVYL